MKSQKVRNEMELVHWIDRNGTDRGTLTANYRHMSELAPMKGRIAVVDFNGVTLYHGVIVGLGRVNVTIRNADGYDLKFKRENIVAVAERSE